MPAYLGGGEKNHLAVRKRFWMSGGNEDPHGMWTRVKSGRRVICLTLAGESGVTVFCNASNLLLLSYRKLAESFNGEHKRKHRVSASKFFFMKP